jgi:His/Glu/Gln/Arg/opine family amino acid ABC transporter permease subunit
MKRTRPPRSIDIKSWTLQGVALILFFSVVGYLAFTAWDRMRSQGIAYGFDILSHATGWKINSPFLNQAPEDPYWWTLCVAFVNTAAASALGILIASALGFCIGVGLVGRNKVVAAVCSVYVEVFRNLPLVLQAVFWYITFTALPASRDAPPSLWNAVFLSNQGLYLPTLVTHAGRGREAWALLGGTAVVFAVCYWACSYASVRGWKRLSLGSVAAAAVAAICLAVRGVPFTIDVPQLTGFGFTGGLELPLELIALVYATVLFGAAYIAEIVRGGLRAVPRGQVEAAQALGLSAATVFFRVRLPIALRSMIPPLGNQFLFIVKATAIGAAIGYSDLFAVSVVAISQTGQAIEFVFLMMLVYFALNYSITQLMSLLNRKLAFEGSR